jgi:hypothetical protein
LCDELLLCMVLRVMRWRRAFGVRLGLVLLGFAQL